jgi:hypothetical protein
MAADGKGTSGLYYRKRVRKGIQSVSLNADMIRLLLAIDEKKSIYQIAAEVEMEPAALRKNLANLLEQGLVEPVRRKAPGLDKTFLQAMRLNLSRIVGPMAEIVIEDGLADLNIDPADIQLNQAAELIDHIAREIPDEGGQIRFKKSMIPILEKVKPHIS